MYIWSVFMTAIDNYTVVSKRSHNKLKLDRIKGIFDVWCEINAELEIFCRFQVYFCIYSSPRTTHVVKWFWFRYIFTHFSYKFTMIIYPHCLTIRGYYFHFSLVSVIRWLTLTTFQFTLVWPRMGSSRSGAIDVLGLMAELTWLSWVVDVHQYMPSCASFQTKSKRC